MYEMVINIIYIVVLVFGVGIFNYFDSLVVIIFLDFIFVWGY